MVHPLVIKVGREIITRHAPKLFSKYNKTEKKLFTSLYGHARGRGVRHGLAGGSAIGSLISSDGLDLDNGSLSQINGTTSGTTDKTRSGQFRVSGKKYRSKYHSRARKRCTCPRKYKSGSYR